MSERSKSPSWETQDKPPEELECIDWNFPDADTKYLTHGIHPYPARMVPQIASHLISYFLHEGDIRKGDRIYDPFAGSGTTGVEAKIHGLNSILADINPLACELSRVKANPPVPGLIKKAKVYLYHPGNNSQSLSSEIEDVEAGKFGENLNSNYQWFPEPQLSQLGILKDRIDALEERFGSQLARFFRIALSETSRLVSYQRNNEYKRYRMSEADRSEFDPDVMGTFSDVLDGNIGKVCDFHESVNSSLETEVIQTDARMPSEIENSRADMVLTSPPYGDHKTTVAYGQFSTDPAVIANGEDPENMRAVDRNGLGGKSELIMEPDGIRKKSKTLDLTLTILENKNGRAADALKFFADYYETIKQNKRILKPGQPLALVVANRTMSGVNIPTHRITIEFYEYLNFDIEHIIPRDIQSKTLPFENSPGGIPDHKGDLMANEYILIMRSRQM